MITITVTIELFVFEELSEDSKNRAINDVINTWMEVPDFVPDDARAEYDRACNDAEKMQTPWFCGEYIWDYCKQWVVGQLGEYYFTKDGEFYKYIEE